MTQMAMTSGTIVKDFDVIKDVSAFHAALFAVSGNDTLIEAIAEYARRTYPVRLSTGVSPEYLERARKAPASGAWRP
jgi:DNA-binding GntR family transcriptional regulator